MGIRVGLGVLAALLLLTVSVSDGMVTTKCELANQLMAIIPPDVPYRESQVAKIVCHAEVTSQFDTSVINSQRELPGGRKPRAVKTTKPPTRTTTKPSAKTTTKPPPRTTPRPPPRTTAVPATTNPHNLQNSTAFPNPHKMNNESMYNTSHPLFIHNNRSENENHSAGALLPPPPPPPPNGNPAGMNSRRKRGLGEQWTLYGVFQLADHVTCTSPTKKNSFNFCNTNCNNLIDDNTSDDVQCVWNIINNNPVRKTGPGNPNREEMNKLVKTMRGMIMNTCPNVDYAEYLAECNP